MNIFGSAKPLQAKSQSIKARSPFGTDREFRIIGLAAGARAVCQSCDEGKPQLVLISRASVHDGSLAAFDAKVAELSGS